MKLINRENGEELVEVGSHKDYASKGVAGAGLGLGIAGTALWLLSGGLGGGLFGNRFGAAGAAALGVESTVEKEDKCELVLPNTPTVTGYPSYNPCRVDNSTSTPAA